MGGVTMKLRHQLAQARSGSPREAGRFCPCGCWSATASPRTGMRSSPEVPPRSPEILAAIGVPGAVPTAWITSLLELVGGISIMFGAAVLPLALPFVVVMLTAISACMPVTDSPRSGSRVSPPRARCSGRWIRGEPALHHRPDCACSRRIDTRSPSTAGYAASGRVCAGDEAWLTIAGACPHPELAHGRRPRHRCRHRRRLAPRRRRRRSPRWSRRYQRAPYRARLGRAEGRRRCSRTWLAASIRSAASKRSSVRAWVSDSSSNVAREARPSGGRCRSALADDKASESAPVGRAGAVSPAGRQSAALDGRAARRGPRPGARAARAAGRARGGDRQLPVDQQQIVVLCEVRD